MTTRAATVEWLARVERKLLTLAAMSLGFGVVQLDVTIVNTALNDIGMSLGAAYPNCNGSSVPIRLPSPRTS
jgi:hypothetical protein